MGYKAKVYYETSVKTPIIWYNGDYSGSLVHNGTSYVFANGSLSAPEYQLSLEKIPTAAQASASWCIKGTTLLAGSSTMNLQVGYAKGDVQPLSTEDEAPGIMSGVTIGFASDMWATSMTIEVYLVQPEDMFSTTPPQTVYDYNVKNTEPLFSYNFLENDNIVDYYNQGYVVKGVKIYLNNWSGVNYPVITYVAPYLVQTYEKENGLLGFKTGYQSLPDNNEPYFGIVAGYGELKLFDKNDNIFKLANLDMLRQRQTVKLFVDDVVVGTYVTESWNYNAQTREVSISLEDDFIDLQETSVEAINLIETKNSYSLHSLIATSVFGDTSTFLPFKYRLQTTITYTGITIGSFYLNKATTWQTLNKICQFFGVCLFKTGQEWVSASGNYARRQKVVLGSPDFINGDIYEVTPDKVISDSVTTNLTNKNYIEGVSYDRYVLETSSGETLATVPIFKTKTGAQASATNTVYNYSFLNTLLEYVPNTAEEYDYGLPTLNLAYGSSDWQGNTHEFLGELTSVSTNWIKTMLVDGQSIVVPSNVLIKKDLFDAGNVKISWPVFEIPLSYNGSSYYFRAQDIKPAKKTGALGANLGPISYTAEEVSGTIGEEELSLSFDVPNWDYYYNVNDAPNNIPVVKVNYVSTKNTTTPAYPNNMVESVHFVPYLMVSYEGATFKEVVTPAQIGATKNIYTLETNELMNEETTTTSGKLVDIRAQQVLTKYKNGKKTAKLSCLYGTPYYTSSGLLSNYQLLTNPHFDLVTGWTSTATSPITATQVLPNPDFSVATGWTAKPSTTMFINTTLKHLIFSGYGAFATFEADENETYYFAALVKTSDAGVKLLGLAGSTADVAYHTGSNEYELLSILTTSTATALRTLSIESLTAVNDCYVKYAYGYKLSDLKTSNPYSPMFETTFNNLTNYQIKLQMNAWFQEGIMPSGYKVISNSAFVVRTIGTPFSITQTATLPTATIYYAFETRTSSSPIEFKMGSLTTVVTGTGFESGIFTNTNSNPVSIKMIAPPTGLREIVVEFVYAINVTNLINNKVYSPMFGTTFDLLQDEQIKAQLDYWVSGTSRFSEILVNQEVKDDVTGWASDVSSLSWTDNTIFPQTTTNRYVLDIYQSKQVIQSGEYYFAAKAKATTNAASLTAASFYNPQPNQIKATLAYQGNPSNDFFYELSAIYSVSSGADLNQLFKVYSNDRTPSRTLHLDWFRAYDLSKLGYVYSPLFSTTFFSLTTAQKKQQMDFWMQSGYLEEALSLAEVPLKEAIGAIGAYGNVFVPGMGVTPFIVKNGVNAPLATYKNGTPITYVVTGAEFEYDGSSRMNLELLERTLL